MKFQAVFFGLLLIVGGAMRVSAQTVTYDSLPINVILYAPYPAEADSLEGKPDSMQAHIGTDIIEFYAVEFAIDNQVVLFQKGATMHVYWKRVSSDSCAALLTFLYEDNSGKPPKTDPNTVEVIEGGPENVWNMTSVTVPDSGYNALQIEVDVNGTGGPGADSCFIDAIELVQHDSVSLASVAQISGSGQPALANYPNPFYHASGTRVQVHVPVAGIGMLSVTDALGREVKRVPMGELSAGDAGDIEATLSLDRAGVFFVRLFIDGEPYGVPLEVSGE